VKHQNRSWPERRTDSDGDTCCHSAELHRGRESVVVAGPDVVHCRSTDMPHHSVHTMNTHNHGRLG